MILNETYSLLNGVQIPKLGLGTWMIENEAVVQVVKDAIELGYRHIDTAAGYQNEEGVGRGIKESGVNREDLFVTSKVEAHIKDYDDAVKVINESLERLDIGYIDLMLIHSPQPWHDYRGEDLYFEGNLATWRAFEEAYEAGKFRAIGVSNFEQVDLENLIQNGKVKPMVNQILAHITNIPTDLIAFCQSQDIVVEAYSPIAHGAILDHPVVRETAEKYGVSAAQLCIRYVLELGTVALPKSSKKNHIQSNAEMDFTISEEDMTTLANLPLIETYGEDEDMPIYKYQFKDKE
ncbi:aldo/keto reductase [Jeotgalibaca caeni]|uniref:aldo/keto reductase n=1 Tax=Jeotgalibaca caeni TaxID=3028623 RepID=UPI00237DA63D|nr:aldo/keto reductase [Jeotgalibaca caeni]MDE1549471.1 aldo/keto reductase [Jeotgalibaca caeni]